MPRDVRTNLSAELLLIASYCIGLLEIPVRQENHTPRQSEAMLQAKKFYDSTSSIDKGRKRRTGMLGGGCAHSTFTAAKATQITQTRTHPESAQLTHKKKTES